METTSFDAGLKFELKCFDLLSGGADSAGGIY